MVGRNGQPQEERSILDQIGDGEMGEIGNATSPHGCLLDRLRSERIPSTKGLWHMSKFMLPQGQAMTNEVSFSDQ